MGVTGHLYDIVATQTQKAGSWRHRVVSLKGEEHLQVSMAVLPYIYFLFVLACIYFVKKNFKNIGPIFIRRLCIF